MPLTVNEHYIACLEEETDEVGQRAIKALRFGVEEIQPGQSRTNAQRIMDEMMDLLTVAEILHERGILPRVKYEKGSEQDIAKREKLARFLDYSISKGCVIPDDIRTMPCPRCEATAGWEVVAVHMLACRGCRAWFDTETMRLMP